jgi:short-subunit dehydrogenase
MSIALVTGATAGLGRGFADALAAEGHDLIIVARNVKRLDAAAEEIAYANRVDVQVLPADLSDTGERSLIEDRLRSETNPVGILVNNAGLGLNQRFVGGDLIGEQQMIDVMVTTPVRLCHAVLPGMVNRGTGAILNVSSVAGWLPSGTYSAAKAYTTSFTEGLAVELAGTGVTATAVCPGFTRTEFHDRAGLNMAKVPGYMWLDVDDVVDQALKDAKKGQPISIAGMQYRALRHAAQHAPRAILRQVARL